MNYYEHHIGDYEAATAHLTLVEDAIYGRMLRWYYRKEEPLPADAQKVARLIRASDQVDVVRAVLLEFFTLADDGWHHDRCDRDIEKYREKTGRASANAKARWANVKPECERNADALPPHSEGNAHQTPDTNHQTEKQKQLVQRAAARFPEFWSAYPVKKGRAAAERVWRSRGLDVLADGIIAHVRRMQAEDDDWRRGYVPHGSTYIAGERWHDEPKRARAGPQQQAQPSKTRGVIEHFEVLKHGGLADNGTSDGFPETALLGFGSDPGD